MPIGSVGRGPHLSSSYVRYGCILYVPPIQRIIFDLWVLKAREDTVKRTKMTRSKFV